jgi:hypothetical protein
MRYTVRPTLPLARWIPTSQVSPLKPRFTAQQLHMLMSPHRIPTSAAETAVASLPTLVDALSIVSGTGHIDVAE